VIFELRARGSEHDISWRSAGDHTSLAKWIIRAQEAIDACFSVEKATP
jgi:hypothetical protein